MKAPLEEENKPRHQYKLNAFFNQIINSDNEVIGDFCEQEGKYG